MYDQSNIAGPAFRSFDKNHRQVTQALITKYDGCGQAIERWQIDGVELALDQTTDTTNEDDIIARWFVFCENCTKVTLNNPQVNTALMYHI